MLGTGSPGRPPRLSHSSSSERDTHCLFFLGKLIRIQYTGVGGHTNSCFAGPRPHCSRRSFRLRGFQPELLYSRWPQNCGSLKRFHDSNDSGLDSKRHKYHWQQKCTLTNLTNRNRGRCCKGSDSTQVQYGALAGRHRSPAGRWID